MSTKRSIPESEQLRIGERVVVMTPKQSLETNDKNLHKALIIPQGAWTYRTTGQVPDMQKERALLRQQQKQLDKLTSTRPKPDTVENTGRNIENSKRMTSASDVVADLGFNGRQAQQLIARLNEWYAMAKHNAPLARESIHAVIEGVEDLELKSGKGTDITRVYAGQDPDYILSAAEERDISLERPNPLKAGNRESGISGESGKGRGTGFDEDRTGTDGQSGNRAAKGGSEGQMGIMGQSGNRAAEGSRTGRIDRGLRQRALVARALRWLGQSLENPRPKIARVVQPSGLMRSEAEAPSGPIGRQAVQAQRQDTLRKALSARLCSTPGPKDLRDLATQYSATEVARAASYLLEQGEASYVQGRLHALHDRTHARARTRKGK